MLGKVKFHGNGGYDHEQEEAKKTFTIGEWYEVEECNIGSWSSTYKIKGYSQLFNTCLFEDSEIFDKAVTQWRKDHYGWN